MKDILLIQPFAYSKYPGMPMGIIHTASALESEHDVTVLDLPSTPKTDKELEEVVGNGDFDVVMIGGTSPSQPEAYTLAELVKKVNKNVIVIKGGPHELFYPHKTAQNPNIDFVLSGDGETAPELLRKIEKEEQNEKVFIGNLDNLNSTTLPNRQLLYPQNPRYYDFLGKPTAQIRSNRGCTFHCTYCSQGIYREYPLEYIFNDINQIAKQGFQAIYWDDAIVTLKRERLNAILQHEAILQHLQGYSFTIGGITRAGVNTDEEILRKMYDAGFRYIWFALESANEGIRKKLGREETGTEKVKEAVKNAWKIGLRPNVNIIIGSPGESYESIQETIAALIEIRPYGVSTSVYTIYPGINGCDENAYEKPVNRDSRLMHFDEGFGGRILIDSGQAEEWYFYIAKEIAREAGIKMLDFKDCKTPKFWFEQYWREKVGIKCER